MFKKLVDNSALKSPWIYHINTGSCNGCDIELVAVLTPRYDAERSPRSVSKRSMAAA